MINNFRLSRIFEVLLAIIFGYSALTKAFGFFPFLLKFSKISIVYSLNLWWTAYVLLAVELLIAFCLLFSIKTKAAAYLTMLTLIIFTAYLSSKIIGNDPEGCSCGGIFDFISIPVHIFINIVMIAMCYFIISTYEPKEHLNQAL